MKISACWIVKNEAANLAASIMSVKDCAEELIVVDTGSTDETVRVAQENGARVEHFEWVNDFSAARNFALSLASGDYVIFIDGDEYFSPALTTVDGIVIAGAFTSARVEALLVPRVEINAGTNEEICTVPHGRIFERKAIRYVRRIHEMAVLKDGAVPRGFMLNQYRLMHLWYGTEWDALKLRRNIALLEAEQPELQDDFSRFNNRAYLLREYMALDEYDKAIESCRYLLDNYREWRVMCKSFLPDYVQRFYAAIRLAAIRRFRFSRKEVYVKLFQEIKNNYPGSREAAFADLYYQLIFDYREDRFLKELDEVTRQIQKLPPPLCAEAQQAESLIYGRAAMAAYYRGDAEKSRSLAERAGILECASKDNQTGTYPVPRPSAYPYLSGPDSGTGGDILRKEYQKAFDAIIQEMDKGSLDHTLLEFLLVIAEKAPAPLAALARERFETGMALLNEAIDLSDFNNTGYVRKILSIIIPYYKETADELFFLLTSISGQVGIRFENIECILVNDGSGDKLPEDFAALFDTISLRCIYLTENKGPGVARQAGLDEAAGEYVMFCDADDTLQHVWALRTFFEVIDKEKPDLIYTPIIIEYYNPVNQKYIYGHKDDMVQILHGKVYNLAYLRGNNIRFHENLRLYEDIYFNEIAFAGSQRIQKTEETSYLKKYRADSITRSDSYSYFIETMAENIQSVSYLCDEFERRYPEKLPGLLAQKIVYFYFVMHWPQWEGANEQLLLRKGEKMLRRMLIPRTRDFEQVTEDDFARIYNRQRAKYFTWDGEIEPFSDWLEIILRGA